MLDLEKLWQRPAWKFPWNLKSPCRLIDWVIFFWFISDFQIFFIVFWWIHMNPHGLIIIMMIMRYSIWGLLMSCDALWCLVLSLLSARFQHGRLRAAIGGGQLGVAQVSQGILSNNLELYITSNICRISTYNIYIYVFIYIIFIVIIIT